MTYLDKQEFLAWAYDDLLTNTTRLRTFGLVPRFDPE